ncbi:MAG: hypothetical protein H7A25_06305 [Leptospiraceae bacterium]|nr:hypothetical protein [Leptospiraceae bacterium]MCP5499496.1 hypothetical protein [Leptospiraceae bacterium]
MKTTFLFLFIIFLSFCSKGKEPEKSSVFTLLNVPKMEEYSERPVPRSQRGRSLFADEKEISNAAAIQAALSSGTILQTISTVSNGSIPSRGKLQIKNGSYLKSSKSIRFQSYDGSLNKKFSCELTGSIPGNYEIPGLSLQSIDYIHDCSYDLGSFSGPVHLGVLNYLGNSGFLSFISSGAVPAGATVDGTKGMRLNVVSLSRGYLPEDFKPSSEEELMQGGVLVTSITHPPLITPLINQVVGYTLESYLPITSSLSSYAPDKENNSTFPSKLISTKEGNYKIKEIVTKQYTFKSTFFATPDTGTHLGFYNNNSGIANLYSLIPEGVYSGKMVDDSGKQIDVSQKNIYFGQAYTGTYQNANCGASASKMACAILGACENVSVADIRNYIISKSNATGYLTWTHIDSIMNNYVGSSVYSRRTKTSNILETDIDAEIDNNRVVMALIQTVELSKDTSDTTFPITKRYYSFEGNHYVVIANKTELDGVKYYVVLDPSSWETYTENGKTNYKGYGVYYKASELLRAMNHVDVTWSAGNRSYATVQY